MKGKQILLWALTVACLVALLLAWPTIAGMARKPRVGDWVPNEDPGTLLIVRQEGRSCTLALGQQHYSCDVACNGDAGAQTLQASIYAERDGELGEAGDRVQNRSKTTGHRPQHEMSIAGGGGYLGEGHLLVEVGFSDGASTKATVGPPIDIGTGTQTGWKMLAVAWDLGVLIEWSQTKQHLLIRRNGLPGAVPPTWGNGQFRVGEQGCAFTEDTQIARLFRARVPELRDGVQNVTVTILAVDDEIFTTIAVK